LVEFRTLCHMETTAKSALTGIMAITAILALGAPSWSSEATTSTDDGIATATVTVADEASAPMPTPFPIKPPSQMAHERATIEWARDLFADAGLDLPYVDINFEDDLEACEGNQGTVRAQDDGSPIIRICVDHDKPAVRETWRRRALVHELAHVWEAANVDDATREAFMALRGLTEWNDRTDAWYRRGTEHAAEVVTWSLIDFRWGFANLPDNSCNEMLAGYETLTGLAPLNGLAVNCSG
jgi:hypothetical protein